MTIRQFKKRTEDEQLNLVMEKGIFLLEHKRYNVVIKLFQLNSFYVEVYSLKETDEVIMINGFEETSLLEPYLSEIDVSSLVEF